MTDEGKAEAGEVLRLARVRSGLSLRAAAEMQGIPPRTMNDIEQGKVAVTGEHVAIMAQRLEMVAKTGDA